MKLDWQNVGVSGCLFQLSSVRHYLHNVSIPIFNLPLFKKRHTIPDRIKINLSWVRWGLNPWLQFLISREATHTANSLCSGLSWLVVIVSVFSVMVGRLGITGNYRILQQRSLTRNRKCEYLHLYNTYIWHYSVDLRWLIA